jgi:hypothetical protein
MKDKGLFDGIPEPDLTPPTGEPVFMPSVADESRRTAEWMERHFGQVTYMNESFHHLRCEIYGLTVHAVLWGESKTVDWLLARGVRSNRAGCTRFGDTLDNTIPSPILVAADYVQLRGGTGHG